VTKRNKTYDLLSVGELLVDYISKEFAENLDNITNYVAVQGGSPANLCLNMARLGNATKLIASVGKDEMGDFLLEEVKKNQIDCSSINRSRLPTTIILVSRSDDDVGDFKPYRGADTQINGDLLKEDLLINSSIFHTTCFALSKNPARHFIIEAAKKAHESGGQLSIDLNYSPKIWIDQKEAQQVIQDYVSQNALVKISEVDWERIFGDPFAEPEYAIDYFLKMGASEVCVTLGSEGCMSGNSEENYFLPSREIEVKDTTGAGDAFWSGYLTAWLDGCSLEQKTKAGRRMAEIKLGHFGPIRHSISKEILYKD